VKAHETACNILLVEDNPMDVELTQRALAQHKLIRSLQIARDGAEALAYLTHWEAGEPVPTMILLDLKLPKVNGLEVLRHIKTHPKFRLIPIIVLTSSSEDQDIQTAYQLGANSYVVKPVRFDQFTQIAAEIEQYWCVLNTPPR